LKILFTDVCITIWK